MTSRDQQVELERLRAEVGVLRQLLRVHEDASLTQTRKLENILRSIHDGLIVLSPTWRLSYMNRAAEAILTNMRQVPQALVGANFWESFPELLGSEIESHYRKVMAERVPVWFEFYYARAGIWFDIHAYPSEDGISVFLQDVSRRKEEEQQLRRTEKMAVTGELAASIAHEINNPMQAITNILTLLLYKTAKTEAYPLAEMAERECTRIARIAKQMLSFYSDSRTEGLVKATDLVEDALELAILRQRPRGLVIERRYDFDGGIHTMRGEMQHLFSGVVANAVDAVGEGGRLIIHVRRSRDWGNFKRHGLRVVIADSGRGIAPEVRPRIFEPFFTTKGEKGSGLGLWVAKNILEKHNGSIRLRSQSHGTKTGTVVSIFLDVRLELDPAIAAQSVDVP